MRACFKTGMGYPSRERFPYGPFPVLRINRFKSAAFAA